MTSYFYSVDCSANPPALLETRITKTWRGWWWESSDGKKWNRLSCIGWFAGKPPEAYHGAPPWSMTTQEMRDYDRAEESMQTLRRAA